MQRERLGNLQAQNRRNTAQIYAMQQEISRLASGIGKRYAKFSTDHLVLVGQTLFDLVFFSSSRQGSNASCMLEFIIGLYCST